MTKRVLNEGRESLAVRVAVSFLAKAGEKIAEVAVERGVAAFDEWQLARQAERARQVARWERLMAQARKGTWPEADE